MRSFKKDIIKSGGNSTGKNVVQTIFKNKVKLNDTNNIIKIDGFEAKITLKKQAHVKVEIHIGELGNDNSGTRWSSSFYVYRDGKKIGCDDSSNEALFKGFMYGDSHYYSALNFTFIDENVPAGTHIYDLRISPHGNNWINRGREYDSDKYDRGTISTMILEEIPIGGN